MLSKNCLLCDKELKVDWIYSLCEECIKDLKESVKEVEGDLLV